MNRDGKGQLAFGRWAAYTVKRIAATEDFILRFPSVFIGWLTLYPLALDPSVGSAIKVWHVSKS
jgi:hypothetical protein